MSLEFLVTSLIVVVLPGAGVIYTLAHGLGLGARASLYAAVGCTLGIVPHMLASIVGLAAILHASALAFEVIRYLGVAYLFFMAWQILRQGGSLDVQGENRPRSPRAIITQAIMVNSLNPKLSLFSLAFLPQFVPAGHADPAAMMGLLALVFMALTLLFFIAYGLLAAMARDYVISKPRVMRWLRQGFAASFALLGLRLALSDR